MKVYTIFNYLRLNLIQMNDIALHCLNFLLVKPGTVAFAVILVTKKDANDTDLKTV